MACNQSKFNCSKCNEHARRERGCEEDSPIPGRWKVGGEALQRCPAALVGPESWLAIRLYRQYKNGFLPESAGILDQAAEFLDDMEIIEAAVQEDQEEKEKQRQQSPSPWPSPQ